SIATAEKTQPEVWTPIQCIQEIGRQGLAWSDSAKLTKHLTIATQSLLQECPDIPRRVARLYQDPLTNQEGSLTPSRNYNSYARGMNEIIQMKYNDIRSAIRSGRIADEGCADGALLAEVSIDFPDSDLYGIDISAEFAHRFQERQRSGDFGGAYVHFYQRNLLHPIFEPESVDTVICNSTLHELWSYGEEEKTIRDYLKEKWNQLRPGGRLIIRDVVGPEAGGQQVILKCNMNDGQADLSPEGSREPEALQALSTWARFKVFTEDFLAAKPQRAAQLKGYKVLEDGAVSLSLSLAMEFCTKKDYTDNWSSEMNEEFCFWSYQDWKKVLKETGFHVVETPNQPENGSRTYCNDWIIENRYEGKVRLMNLREEAIRFPATNMVLVAEKGHLEK
ncbi:MAG: methyltransferase domain-containing protein, partial [Verrucomicrobiota bacterium]